MKVQNLFFLKMLVLLFSAILKKFGGLISNVMSPIESKNPHPLIPLGVKKWLYLHTERMFVVHAIYLPDLI